MCFFSALLLLAFAPSIVVAQTCTQTDNCQCWDPAGCSFPNCETNCQCPLGNCDMPKCTDNCQCAGGNCDLPSCDNNCQCPGGKCEMKACSTNCQCWAGACDMSACSSNCQCWSGYCNMPSCGSDCCCGFNPGTCSRGRRRRELAEGDAGTCSAGAAIIECAEMQIMSNETCITECTSRDLTGESYDGYYVEEQKYCVCGEGTVVCSTDLVDDKPADATTNGDSTPTTSGASAVGFAMAIYAMVSTIVGV